jgi:phenylalanyl-tRNA synthetase beta chain
MHVSGKWLQELVDLPKETTPAQIAERLTAAGLEVEEVKDLAAALKGVVVGRVLSCVPHENADKLKVCSIDGGGATPDGPVTVVCGADNVVAGAVVCFATPGTTLPNGKSIGAAAVRGVMSQGMLCSAEELGLPSDGVSGLLLLNDGDPGVNVGAPVAAVVGCDDVVYTLSVTPNRPDALSHLGVARELAAAFRSRLKGSTPSCPERGGPIDGLATVTIEDLDGCPRYACRVIEDVVVQPSPRWLAARLSSLGMRSINTIVDVTNLVMLERGLPLHAFDYDKVAKSGSRATVIVRSARAGEKIVTLDGKERSLLEGDVVIGDSGGDNGRAIAVAGVMGGRDTEVSTSTTRVLLEAAHFNPARVRKTARRLELHSEASHRFERGTDPNGVQQALDRAAALIAELSITVGARDAKGRVARGTVDVYPKKIAPAIVTLRPKRAAQLLGVPAKLVDEASASKILLSLGLEVEGRDSEAIRFRVPTFRPDLTREVDLIEELLRLLGMDQVPSTLPSRAGESESRLFDTRRHKTLQAATKSLLAAGYDEAVNLAFASPSEIEAFPPWDRVGGEEVIRLKNPLGEERGALRRSLLPALVQNAALNHRRGVTDVRLFESAVVFLGRNPGGDAPRPDEPGAPAGGDAWVRERPRLAGIASGNAGALSFDTRSRPLDLFDVKGHLEELLEQLGCAVTFTAAGDDAAVPFLHPRSATWINTVRDGVATRLGILGELHPALVEAAEMSSAPVVFDLDLDLLSASASPLLAVRPLPRFPSVRRDFALTVDVAVPAAALVGSLEGCVAAKDLLEKVEIFDVYQGPGVPEGKKSVAITVTLRSAERTLAESDVQRVADAMLADVSTLGAEVRTGVGGPQA